MRLFEQPSFFNAGFLPWSSGIPWQSPYTSNIAELPNSWSPDFSSSSWSVPFSIGLGFGGPAMGVPFGVSVAALFANAWAMVSNFPGGFTNPYGSSMSFRPPVRSTGAERGEGSSGPRFSRMGRDPADESDELDGAEEATPDAAGAPAAGGGKTTDITKLTDWADADKKSAGQVSAAARKAAKAHPKFTVTVRFGPGKTQVTIYAAPKKNPAPTDAERALVQTALRGINKHGLTVQVVVGNVSAGGTTTPSGPNTAAADTAIAAANKSYTIIVSGKSVTVCKIVRSDNTLSVLTVMAGTLGAAAQQKSAAATANAKIIAKNFGLTGPS